MWDLIVSIPDHCLSFYFSKMFKRSLRKTVIMHAISFIATLREQMFCLEHLIKTIFSSTRKNAMLSPPTRTKFKVNDEGSLHSFSIGMHDIKNL